MQSGKSSQDDRQLRIGWKQVDITPDKPVFLAGQFHVRVSEGILDPISATVLALESPAAGPAGRAIFVVCDLVTIPDNLRDGVRERVGRLIPDLDVGQIVINATHTHTAPEARAHGDADAGTVASDPGFTMEELGATPPGEYLPWVIERIAGAVADAWKNRAPGGISWGLGQAVVGHNRRWMTYDGRSTMYGNTDTPEFSHIEGYEDHSLNVLFTWDADRRLTGVIVNLACPSQETEHLYTISADHWCETRQALRGRFGEKLYVLPQISPAGDQSPHLIFRKRAEQRMMDLKGHSRRQEIAARIAAGVGEVFDAVKDQIDTQPVLRHTIETVKLPHRPLSESDVREALAEADVLNRKYDEERRRLQQDPAARQQPRWYVTATAARRRAAWFAAVEKRFRSQQTTPEAAVEVHVVRLGDIALAFNPFELYLDFGIHIHCRSRAIQNFLVQLAGSGTYLPTERSMVGGAYGAVPASTPFGPEAGRKLAGRTVELINALWDETIAG